MSTTPIIVEILIVGIQGMVWVILLTLGLFPDALTQLLVEDTLKPVVAVAFVGLAYSFGVILDRLVRLVFANLVPSFVVRFLTRLALSPRERAAYVKSKRTTAKAHDRLYRARVLIQLYHPDAMAVLEVIRSRVRIARATVFNMIVTVFAALFYLYHGTKAELVTRPLPAVGVVVGGVLVIVLALMAYGVLDWNYRHRKQEMLEVREAEEHLQPKQ